jgi:hypothetical protein
MPLEAKDRTGLVGTPPSLPSELQPSSLSIAFSVASLSALDILAGKFCFEQFDLLEDASFLLLLPYVFRLLLVLYLLDSNCDHGLESVDGIIASVMKIPADDSQFKENHAKLSGVRFTLEISPHECRISRLQQGGQVGNIVANSLHESNVRADIMTNENDVAFRVLVMTKGCLF